MPKEKTKTQSRKKQETDVSDALFHVTPQPTIDIFEVLGGAINVQTAAFLTGKIDNINASPTAEPIPAPAASLATACEESPSTPPTTEPITTPLASSVTPPFASSAPAQTAPQASSLHTVPNSLPASTTIPSQNAQAESIVSPTIPSSEPLLPETISLDILYPAQSSHTTPSIKETSQTPASQVGHQPTIKQNHTPKQNSFPSPHTQNHATSHATSLAISSNTNHSTANSMDRHDHENSTTDSSHDTSPASHTTITQVITPDTHDNSTETSIANSTQNNPIPLSSVYQEKRTTTTEVPPLYSTHTNAQNAPIQGPHLLSQLTKREEELLQFLRHHHGQIVSYSQMLKSLNWRESQRCTARNIIARFEANGIIKRQRIQGTRSQGYLFTMCEHANSQPYPPQQSPFQATPYGNGYSGQNTTCYAQTLPPETPLHLSVSSIGSSAQHSHTPSLPNSIPSYIDKIDRLIQSIWQSDQETIAACWPAVAAVGFRAAHLRQLQSIFELQGFEPDTVPLGLRYLDWQLEQGPLTNARGEVIEDPIAYWLSSMRRHGYYSRPKGYVDPLLEAKRLIAEEEQTKFELQAQLEQARQQNESAAEEKRCECLFAELIAQGPSHPAWKPFYQRLPQMFRQKVDTEGPEALAKKFAMVKALVKEIV